MVTVFFERRVSPKYSYSPIVVVSELATSCAFRKRFPLTRGAVRALTLTIMSPCAYILRCSDGCYYYGSTNDLLQRLGQHRRGRVHSTAWRLPVELMYFEEFETLEQAKRREQSFKNGRTRRKTIENLIRTFPPEKLAPFA